MPTHAEMTKYPKIFKDSYWGNFSRHSDKDLVVFENRCRFVEEFEIVSNSIHAKSVMRFLNSTRMYYHRKYFDHIESYKTRAGCIFIMVSPYDPTIGDVLRTIGFEEIYPLYVHYVPTYIYRIESTRDLKRASDGLRIKISMLPE